MKTETKKIEFTNEELQILIRALANYKFSGNFQTADYKNQVNELAMKVILISQDEWGGQ